MTKVRDISIAECIALPFAIAAYALFCVLSPLFCALSCSYLSAKNRVMAVVESNNDAASVEAALSCIAEEASEDSCLTDFLIVWWNPLVANWNTWYGYFNMSDTPSRQDPIFKVSSRFPGNEAIARGAMRVMAVCELSRHAATGAPAVELTPQQWARETTAEGTGGANQSCTHCGLRGLGLVRADGLCGRCQSAGTAAAATAAPPTTIQVRVFQPMPQSNNPNATLPSTARNPNAIVPMENSV